MIALFLSLDLNNPFVELCFYGAFILVICVFFAFVLGLCLKILKWMLK